MIGRIQAAGLTSQQLEAALTEKYTVFINETDIMVAVLESRSQPVSLIGAVSTPGVRQLDGRKTLLQVLLLAGVRLATTTRSDLAHALDAQSKLKKPPASAASSATTMQQQKNRIADSTARSAPPDSYIR